jgi:8-oxo-dGTP pyrophosphatase MutT (NUDIX family)
MSLPIRNGPVTIATLLTPRFGGVNRRVAGWVDRLCQWGYFLAYRVLCLWWFVRRPEHHGALVALWHDGRLLLVRSSYRATWDLPGGGVGPGEAPEQAALRELAEEVGIRLGGGVLRCVGSDRDTIEYRRDRVTIFEAVLAEKPALRIDHREIVAAAFHDPRALEPGRLNRYVTRYLERRKQGEAARASSVEAALDVKGRH